ncbi:MAG TPA: hypothetical protein PKM48_03015, partial [Parvularculaceae bacterium]|nr:hypothetical protein [Parvularculaceae bacterium]
GALVTSELAQSEKGAATQRARWEHGSLRIGAKKIPGLLMRGLTGDLRALALAIDLAIPPLALFSAMIASML